MITVGSRPSILRRVKEQEHKLVKLIVRVPGLSDYHLLWPVRFNSLEMRGDHRPRKEDRNYSPIAARSVPRLGRGLAPQ
jgi:hypothetical protein